MKRLFEKPKHEATPEKTDRTLVHTPSPRKSKEALKGSPLYHEIEPPETTAEETAAKTPEITFEKPAAQKEIESEEITTEEILRTGNPIHRSGLFKLINKHPDICNLLINDKSVFTVEKTCSEPVSSYKP